jgi:hypothetical protein
MNNFDFALRAVVKVMKPKRDKDDKAVFDKDGKLVKEAVELPGLVRGRIVVAEDLLVIVNETGEEVGRVVVTDGVLDLQEGVADPDKAIRMSPSGGVPTESGEEPDGKKVPDAKAPKEKAKDKE